MVTFSKIYIFNEPNFSLAMQTVQMPKCINFATILQLPSWQPTLCVNWPRVNQISLYSDNLRTMYGIQCSRVGLILKLFLEDIVCHKLNSLNRKKKSYVYDLEQIYNIHWMMYDIGGERFLLVHHKDKEIIRKKMGQSTQIEQHSPSLSMLISYG